MLQNAIFNVFNDLWCDIERLRDGFVCSMWTRTLTNTSHFCKLWDGLAPCLYCNWPYTLVSFCVLSFPSQLIYMFQTAFHNSCYIFYFSLSKKYKYIRICLGRSSSFFHHLTEMSLNNVRCLIISYFSLITRRLDNGRAFYQRGEISPINEVSRLPKVVVYQLPRKKPLP